MAKRTRVDSMCGRKVCISTITHLLALDFVNVIQSVFVIRVMKY